MKYISALGVLARSLRASLLGGLAVLGCGTALAAPAAGTIYIPVDDENSVYVFNTNTGALTTKIGVGTHPIVLKALPDGSKVYVDNFGLLPWQVSVINTATNTVSKTISMMGDPYASFELSKDGRYLYVPTNANVVQVIDTTTDSIVRTIPTAMGPMAVQVSPDGSKLYVFNTSNGLEVYNTATGQRLSAITVSGMVPAWSAISPDGIYVYSLNFTTSNITKIDTRTMTIADTITLPAGSWPLSGTLTPDGRKMWVADIGTYDVTVIDMTTDKIVRKMPTTNAPAFVGLSPDGTKAYLSDLGPVSALPPALRFFIYDFFYVLPPGLTGHVTTYDTSTFQQVGNVLSTGTGPVAGVYF